MVEIKTLVLERIFLLSQTPLIKRILSFLADLRAFFSKDISFQVFFFNFGSILREVYKIVKKKKMYSDDNKDNRQWEVFLSQKAIFL